MIEKSVVEEVLARSNIEGVISPYVSLKRAGGLLKGLCPFHSEKTPSFCVYPKDNSFYCFGCGAGGDAITFVKRIENMDFEDAVETLAKRVGITVLRTERDAPGGPRFDRGRILELNREAARYFHARLFDNTPGAEAAREYLMERRGLSMSVIKHFGLGYAPYDPRGFQQHFFGLGYRADEMIAAFLMGKSETNGALYQSFRDRVMFPVIDVTGNVIAFGGRVLDNAVPKYKN
ncbi:MAG: DNA primase, partial [Clostridia bacterium]|nr:DNA primase [Clostridia bacterium]